MLTVPISLLYSPKQANLNAIFLDHSIVPMVKMKERGSRRQWELGRNLLHDLLRRRIDVEFLLEAGLVEDLVSFSGGHPRQLMKMAQDAVLFVDEPPVPRIAAQKAFRRLVNDYGGSIPEDHWSKLAWVHRDQRARSDDAHQLMLYNLSVLEYQNGDCWCDVHPAILELPQFQAELGRLSDGPPSSSTGAPGTSSAPSPRTRRCR